MKNIILLGLAFLSLNALATEKCDLKSNDQAVDEVNERMDNGRMRGEDHLIALTELYRERLQLINSCVEAETTQGVTQEELIDLREDIKSDSSIVIERLKQEIKKAIESNQIELATRLMIERDLELINTANRVDRINKLIK